jgi:AraC-like DNA-binding protein
MSGRAAILRLASVTDHYLSECFDSESPPRASELAARLGITPVQLSRAFLQGIGLLPAHYLKARQVEFAQRLLRETDLNTNQVAYRAGFGTRATFFRVFRGAVGMTPKRYAVGWRREG